MNDMGKIGIVDLGFTTSAPERKEDSAWWLNCLNDKEWWLDLNTTRILKDVSEPQNTERLGSDDTSEESDAILEILNLKMDHIRRKEHTAVVPKLKKTKKTKFPDAV